MVSPGEYQRQDMQVAAPQVMYEMAAPMVYESFYQPQMQTAPSMIAYPGAFVASSQSMLFRCMFRSSQSEKCVDTFEIEWNLVCN